MRSINLLAAVTYLFTAPLCSVLLSTFIGSTIALSTLNDAQWGWSPSQITPPMAGWKEVYIPIRGNHSQMVYMQSTKDFAQIERIVIVLHGHGRDPWTYQWNIQDSLKQAAIGNATGNPPPVDESKVLLFVPMWWSIGDLAHGGLPTPDPYNQLCYVGDESAWAGQSQCGDRNITSFDAMDDVLSWTVGESFPNLKNLVLASHSLGGFFVHHYALLSPLPDLKGVEINFWVANPAGYTFLDPFRPAARKPLLDCPSYDTWPFGLQSGYNTTYLGGLLPPWQVLWQRYNSRNVHHATGLDDSWIGTMGCEVMVQGYGHRDRAWAFFHRVQTKLGGISPNHTIDYIPGIGHDSYAMLNYPWTVYRMFFESKRDNMTLPSQGLINGDISYQFPNGLKWNATKADKATWIATQEMTDGKWKELTGQDVGGGSSEGVDGDDDSLNDACTAGNACEASGAVSRTGDLHSWIVVKSLVMFGFASLVGWVL